MWNDGETCPRDCQRSGQAFGSWREGREQDHPANRVATRCQLGCQPVFTSRYFLFIIPFIRRSRLKQFPAMSDRRHVRGPSRMSERVLYCTAIPRLVKRTLVSRIYKLALLFYGAIKLRATSSRVCFKCRGKLWL